VTDNYRDDVIERLVRVETHVEGIHARLGPMSDSIDEVADSHRRQRGFVSGVAWAVSTAWALLFGMVYLVWEYLKAHMGQQ